MLRVDSELVGRRLHPAATFVRPSVSGHAWSTHARSEGQAEILARVTWSVELATRKSKADQAGTQDC